MILSAFRKRRVLRRLSVVGILSFAYQLLFPVAALALTSGPSQPEMQSFEPVGTTDMVDLFSGDFNYNIPLLEIEGYPINIAYHAGVTMEQEASWVGLGWNINPGNINHIVRGLSDDFKGEKIEKKLEMEPEEIKNFGLFVGAEVLGLGNGSGGQTAKDALEKLVNVDISGKLDFGIKISNYSGVSASVGISQGVNVRNSWFSAGVNMGTTVSTDEGADFDYSLSASTKIVPALNHTIGLNINGSINSEKGLKYTSFGVNPSLPVFGYSSFGGATYVPIGLQNYVPVITNASFSQSQLFQLKIGGAINGVFPFGGGRYSQQTVKFASDGSKAAYGYFNLDAAGVADIVDFTRDKDGLTNRKSKFLPMPTMTYDLYSVTGQGTGGVFRPFRNDIGIVYDPLVQSATDDESYVAEIGLGNLFSFGGDVKYAYGQATSGAWATNKKSFRKKEPGNTYEPFYFKQAGELTEPNTAMISEIAGSSALRYKDAASILKDPQGFDTRVPRGNLLYYLDGEDARYAQISLMPRIENYSGHGTATVKSTISRIDNSNLSDPNRHKAAEFTQVLPDGSRYIYGLPAMNLWQRDYTVACAHDNNNPYTVHLGSYSNGEPQSASSVPRYFSSVKTPAYAHSYLLTSILSSDYSDLTGDGISEDDLGGYTKFNYSRKNDYYWRIPYEKHTGLYNKGVPSDSKDDKANFSAGCRETWMLHSVESRNFIAEFFTSERADARGTDDNDLKDISNPASVSFKLDSIVLYNKKDWQANGSQAVAVKAILFSYDYSQCSNLPYSTQGKLTLRSIFIRNGNSDAGLLSPYRFNYQLSDNPDYNLSAKDCWGNYKPSGSNNDVSKGLGINLNNYEFPYVNQNDPDNDLYAGAWNLQEVILPSGGRIQVNYEADDYAYVQDKPAMEMFKVCGTGPTKDFIANNTLYHDEKDPYLYVYFRRQASQENYPGDIMKSYLGGGGSLQYNFSVEISSGTLPSDNSGNKLINNVKGYANIVEGGVCPSPHTDYGYFKLSPKYSKALIKESGAKIHPVSLAAINFARYYHPKSLKPSGDLTSTDPGAIIKELINSFSSILNFFENPLKTYLKQNKARRFEANKSYIRLLNQGMKKKGGGHRVSAIRFYDTWDGSNTLASYGSSYDYTITDELSGHAISSGVASYEPQLGGDENPLRNLINTESSGNSSDFPPTDPIELLQEGPVGESLYPPASVGYRKVTITSIHKDQGASSQTIKEHEFYTAKDFPVKLSFTNLETIADKKPGATNVKNRKETYQVAQGYALLLNDMHGKPKKQSTWVALYDPSSPGTIDLGRELVSYTKYEYFTNDDGTLNNSVPCLDFLPGNAMPVMADKTLGVEIDFTADSREKKEVNNMHTLYFNTNAFIAGIPIIIPTIFPQEVSDTKVFSSLVTSKVVQHYGIIKSVERYDKGAIVKMENQAFDPKTGQVLVTKVNTEHSDYEYNVKYPAYWAYRCMGGAYENILLREKIGPAPIKAEKLYLRVGNPDNYNLGDELLVSASVCDGSNKYQDKFKVWVTDKVNQVMNLNEQLYCSNCDESEPVYTYGTNNCITWTQLKDLVYQRTGKPEISTNLTVPYETVVFDHSWTDITRAYAYRGESYCRVYEDDFMGHRGEDTVFTLISSSIPSTYPTTQPQPYTSSRLVDVEFHINEVFRWKYEPNDPWEVEFNSSASPVPVNRTRVMTIKLALPTDATTSSSDPLCGSLSTTRNYIASNEGFNDNSNVHLCDNNRLSWQKDVREEYYEIFPTGQACRVRPRAIGAADFLVASPRKSQAPSIFANQLWPTQDVFLTDVEIKVVRSGKRNQLTETVQELTTISNPVNSSGYLNGSHTGIINATAREFTEAALPAGTTSANVYVSGQKGNYRPNEEYFPFRTRSYNLPGIQVNTTADRYKGVFDAGSFWSFPSAVSSEFYNRMMPGSNSFWKRVRSILNYSPWGTSLEMMDANGNYQSTIMGYGYRIPVAMVSNARYNNAVFENFEDLPDYLGLTELTTYPDNLVAHLATQINDPVALSGPGFSIVGSSHTGVRALQITAPLSVPVSIEPENSALQMTPFYFRTGKKYVVSCWQQVPAGSSAPATSYLKVSGGSINCSLFPRTASIDGWVLYEGSFIAPQTQTTTYLTTTNSNFTIDDLRILPAEANMKAYVYHPVNHRLVAVLDENHMASFFEYSSEGKLIRIKKETERGVLTLKESRESLRNIFINSTGTSVGTPDTYLPDPTN